MLRKAKSDARKIPTVMQIMSSLIFVGGGAEKMSAVIFNFLLRLWIRSLSEDLSTFLFNITYIMIHEKIHTI